MDVLDGMRGAAILLVVLSHIATLLPQKLSISVTAGAVLRGVQGLGAAGTNLSFFLSGYLVWQILVMRAPTPGAFFARRFKRLYPGFAVVTAAYLLIGIALPGYSKLPANPWDATLFIATNLLMLPGIFALPILNTVTWSLSYEWLWYLLAFATVGASRVWQVRRVGRVVLLIGASAAMLAAGMGWGGPYRMILFAAGALAWEARSSGALSGCNTAVPIGLLSILGAMFFAGLPADGMLMTISTIFVWWFVCMHCLATPSSMLSSAFKQRILGAVGSISYPLYLSHGLVVHGMLKMFSEVTAPTAIGILALASVCMSAAVAAAYALRAVLEMPDFVWSTRKPSMGTDQARLEVRG